MSSVLTESQLQLSWVDHRTLSHPYSYSHQWMGDGLENLRERKLTYSAKALLGVLVENAQTAHERGQIAVAPPPVPASTLSLT